MVEELKLLLQNKNTEELTAWISEHPEVLDLEDENGSTGLMLIAYSGQEMAFKKAIGLKGSFSFHEAIVCGKGKRVSEYLAKSGADLANTHSNDGFTPLSLAAFFNQTPIAEALLQAGADPNIPARNPSRVNALHSAVARENLPLCKLLIEMGANVNAVQMQNVTALHSAVHRGNLELTRLLVEHGASADAKMDNGDTPISIAQREGHEEIAAFLQHN